MAPCVAMMADTPQTDEPTASKRRQLRREFEKSADEDHHRDRKNNLDRHQPQAQAAELGHVAQQKPRAQQHDAELQPEFVGLDTGAKTRTSA